MKNLKLYFISESYINYLRNFDKNVPYNKNLARPYIGIVYTYNNFNYFAPLASPKPKHLKINPKAIDIFKIKDGELGVININNMIPTPIEELTEALPLIEDKIYRRLLQKQLTFINDNKNDLSEKINLFQKLYRKGNLNDNIKNRCCNFELLEKLSLKYIK